MRFNVKHYIKEYFVQFIILASLFGLIFMNLTYKPESEALKNYKDGIQNHLTWSIKGECFFVRPHTDHTVYLIRVTDCDKK